jgi:membrane protein
LQDDAQGLAAQLSYYFFLSLFPTLLCLVALASLLPLANLTDEVIGLLQPFAPAQAIEIIRGQMLALGQREDVGLVTLGFAGAVWSSSAAMGAVIGAMNRAYDIEESRPWWKVRLLAIGLTVSLACFILLSLMLVLAGPKAADELTRVLHLGTAVATAWKIIQWPIVFLLVSTGIGIVYYFAPDAEQEWVWVTPGSLTAATLWLMASLGFRAYVVNFGSYEATYGTIGGIIVILLWFYLLGFIIVIGAEMNAEIEHASPWGKKPGEKVPGQKRRLGLAARRIWSRQHPEGA